MTTVQITLTLVEDGTQDWADVESAVHRVMPVNRGLKVRNGLSGAIDTHANGMRVQVDTFDEFAQADRLARALFAEWGMDPAAMETRFEQAREAVLCGITQGARLDFEPEA